MFQTYVQIHCWLTHEVSFRALLQIANLKLDSELDPKDWIEPQDKILQSSPMLDKFLQTLKPHHYFEGEEEEEEAAVNGQGGGAGSGAGVADEAEGNDVGAAASGDDVVSSASADDGSGSGEEAPVVAVVVTLPAAASDKNNNDANVADSIVIAGDAAKSSAVKEASPASKAPEVPTVSVAVVEPADR